ncbi:MAG: serine hydrolase [Myxococcaceae bacterium]|nr:serine hydrolase [Myxococcaceae bacterium]
MAEQPQQSESPPPHPVMSGVPAGVRVPERLDGILDELEKYARQLMKEQDVPGLAFAVVHGDKLVGARGLGTRRAGQELPVTANTLFQIGSITKSFTSTLVALLVDEGKLDWNDRVVEHLPDFEMHDARVGRELRVLDLLCQRSGLPEYSLDAMLLFGFERKDILRALRHVRPVTGFRSAYTYLNSIWLVAARLIEHKSGKSWEELVRGRLLVPLGMKDSAPTPSGVPSDKEVAFGHLRKEDGSLWPLPSDWPYAYELETAGPAGAICSSVRDMSRWMRLHLGRGTFKGRKLVDSHTLDTIHSPRTLMGFVPPAWAHSYAAGWVHDSSVPCPVLWHDGATASMSSFLGLIPDAGLGLVALDNEPDNSATLELFLKFYELALGAAPPRAAMRAPRSKLDLRPLRPGPLAPPTLRAMRTEQEIPPELLAQVLGTYVNPAFGAVTIRERDGQLQLVVGPQGVVAPLHYLGGSQYLYELPDWPGQGGLITLLPVAPPVFGETPSLPWRLVITGCDEVNDGIFVKQAPRTHEDVSPQPEAQA